MRNRLDTTAIVHCALMRDNWINAYRIVVTMDDEVDPDILQQALDSMTERYPTICSRIVKGKFWYYTEKLDKITVREDNGVLLGTVNNKSVFEQATYILYSGNKIILEEFHSITDGHGAFTFLNGLTGAYCAIRNGSLRINAYKGEFVKEELEDGFLRHGGKVETIEEPYKITKPFFFENDAHKKYMDATVFRMKTARVRALAKENHCSMNELLAAVLFRSIFDMKESEGKDVVLTVPINLRRLFETPTLLNFSQLTQAVLKNDGRLKELSEMTAEIRRQIKYQNNEKYLRNGISKIAALRKTPLMRFAPFFLKSFAIRLATKLGAEKSCMTITNLGNIAAMMPAGEKNIRNIDVILAPRRNAPYNCGIISLNEDLNITITHSKEHIRLVEKISEQLNAVGIEFCKEKFI